ncbi:hypothetical protein M9H77_13556 [Catharanthus roseus]|uniref:Uncharacterized protein n=1 Tax=Catharanthus roseus TaxID=4058 RepID=A0ACC0BKI1_CATRO|nr:hypothetical protein M9H77_13556 [Catharanthus roseus]
MLLGEASVSTAVTCSPNEHSPHAHRRRIKPNIEEHMDPFEDFEQENVDFEAKQTAMKAYTYLIVNRYQKSKTSYRRLFVTLACERGSSVRKKMKQIVDDVEKEVPMKRQGPYDKKMSVSI